MSSAALIKQERSYASRKFVLTILGTVLVTMMSLAAIVYPSVIAILPTFIGGILGVLSLYFTGNIMTKYVVGKNLQNIDQSLQNTDQGEA